MLKGKILNFPKCSVHAIEWKNGLQINRVSFLVFNLSLYCTRYPAHKC